MTDASVATHRSHRRDRVLLALGLFVFIWTLTTHGKYSDTGDEPHYLTITRSLVRDHDLDLANNYAAADALTSPGRQVRRARDGTLQSAHDIGLPLLLVPVYAVAEHITATVSDETLRRARMPRDLLEYSIVSLTLLAAVCWSVAVLAAALEHVTSHLLALAIAGLVAVTPPVLTTSFLVFPETLAFIVMCAVAWWLLTPRPRAWTTWLLAAALGYLPWCHRKYSPLILVCVAVMVWQRRDVVRSWSTGTRVGLAALVAMPFVGLYAWTWGTWGNLGGPQLLDYVPLSVWAIPHGFAGLLMDRQFGLVADAPLYLGLFAYWAQVDRARRTWLLIVASLVLPMSAFANWTAGFSPLARYLVPILPFCGVALADSLRAPAMRVAVGALAAVQLVFTAFAWHHPRSLWPWIDGWNPLLRDLGPVGRAYAAWLPLVDVDSLSHTLLCATAIVVFNVGLLWASRRALSRPDGAERAATR